VKKNKSLRLRHYQIYSYAFVSLIPLLFIALFILAFIIKDMKDNFTQRIDLLSQGIRGQIQLYMNQPLTSLNTISNMIDESGPGNGNNINQLLNANIRESHYFEAIYLLDARGTIISAGLNPQKENYRRDLIGINLGHKKEFQAVQATQKPQWSDTFLSLASGKISLTLYVPAGKNILAADINLNTLSQFIYRLSSPPLLTMIIDRNGAILFHPDPEYVGKSIMLNDIPLVAKALQGEEQTGQFLLSGEKYIGSTRVLSPTGWISLIAEPNKRFFSLLIIPLTIIASGICGAIILTLLLAFLRSRKLTTPLMEITRQSSIIADGDYSHSLPPSAISELQQLSNSINHMGISIQKREAELREKELKYRELVENTSNLVLRLNSRTIISYANNALYQLTELPYGAAIGMPFQNCLLAEDWPAIDNLLRQWVAEGEQSGSAECRMTNKHNATYQLLLTFNLHYALDGSLLDINIIGHDMTVRYQIEQQEKEIEEKQQRSQKMELLGMMAGGVAHDLNNILSGIINFPEMLLMQLDPGDPMCRPLESIRSSGERAAAVVADLLTIARGSAAVRENLNLNLIIGGYLSAPEFLKLREIHPHVRFKFVQDAELWPCLCSQTHIEKTLMNLIINAFEAIKEDGQVDVTTANIPAEALAQLTDELAPGPYVSFIIRDSGKGISQDDIKRIFEPFFSKKGLGRSGTGIGLTVAWNSIKEHGGTILVNSSCNGTEFTVLLPASNATTNEPSTATDPLQLKGSGQHILVVDDEEALREIAVNMLQILNYRASSVPSGEKALEFLETIPVDLVLLDMQMDPGINGKETYALIKKRNPDQKALIVTGYSSSEDVQATLEEGAGGFIKKPYNLQALGIAVYNELATSD